MESHDSSPPLKEHLVASSSILEPSPAVENRTVGRIDLAEEYVFDSGMQAGDVAEAQLTKERLDDPQASYSYNPGTGTSGSTQDASPKSDIMDTEIAANASPSSILVDDGPTELQRLRDLVFASRGSKASLPTGWDDRKVADADQEQSEEGQRDIPLKAEADTDDAAQKMLQRAIDLVGQLASDSDIDSDSDSGIESDSSTSTSSHASAIQKESNKKRAKVVLQETLSDDEDEGGKMGAMGPATKNEVLELTVDVPPYSIVPEHQEIRPLGKIHSIVDCVVVVAQDVGMAPGTKQQASNSISPRVAPLDRHGRKGEEEGEYSVLDTGSLLAFQDRNVLGVVFETFGSVLSPLYALRYTSAGHINRDMIQVGKPVYYVPNNSTYVLTRSLRALGKGSDASNLWDEEIGDEEREFSDDEAEAAYKRNAKGAKGKGKKRGNTDEQQIGRPKHHLPMRPMVPSAVHRDASINQQSQALSYDDEDSIGHDPSHQHPAQNLYAQAVPPQSAYAQWLYQQQQQRQQQQPLANGPHGQFQPYQAPGPRPSAAMPFDPSYNGASSSDSYDPQQPHLAYTPSQPPPRW